MRGRTAPYSNRGARSSATSTVPSVHLALRRSERQDVTRVGVDGSWGRTGMQSVSCSRPVPVVTVVTRTFVSGS